jgi:hypothetical protein
MMRFAPTLGLLCLICAGAVGLVAVTPSGGSASTSGAGDPATINAFGFWDLQRLGSDPIRFEHVTGTAKASVPYIIEPDKAKQGPRAWYIAHLHAKVVFGAGTGHAYLFVSHNGYASALIEYDVTGDATNRRVRRRTTSYIDGSMSTTLPEERDDLQFRNYLQYAGVQAGVNQLTFSLEVHGSLDVASVDILGDSGIEYTPVSPAKLTLSVRRTPRLNANRAATLTVDVGNVGGRPIRSVRVALEAADEDLRVVGAPSRLLGTLRPQARRQMTFRIIPRHRGAILVALEAGGRGGNSPGFSKMLNVH